MPLYLDHIVNLNYPLDKIHLAFLVNNSTDDTYDILDDFRDEYGDDFNDIDIWPVDDVANGYVDNRHDQRDMHAFAEVRNLWLDLLNPRDTHIFSIDSDVMVPSQSLSRLLSHSLPMVSLLVCNGYMGPHEYYNIMNWNGHRFYSLTEPDIKEDLMEVGVTGACFLMDSWLIRTGIRYKYNKQGEDLGFCEEVRNRGHKIFCDTTLKAKHFKA
jgi:hypothetical protein